jgi:hypothetical protein
VLIEDEHEDWTFLTAGEIDAVLNVVAKDTFRRAFFSTPI